MNRGLYLYAIAGVVLLLGQALYRLIPLAWAPLAANDLTAIHWAVAVPWIGMMVWTEGVKGFHQKFCPRLVARAARVDQAPLAVRLVAPAMAMGLVWATRRRLIGSWMLLLGVVALVVGVQQLPYPWRNVVDLGVVAGLGTGTASLLWHAVQGWRGIDPGVDPELPASA